MPVNPPGGILLLVRSHPVAYLPTLNYMQQELPENVIWLRDGDQGRYVHRYDFRPFEVGEVSTFYDYHEDGTFDYDSAVTCRVEADELHGEVARKV